jgi:2-C-methyl-D-erythritol 4-phosphate cytidylyltransferase
MKLIAMIVAAGNSQRMGFDKLMAPLAGRPVLQHSIEAFLQCDDVAEVILVCPEERFTQLDLEFANKIIRRVDGGADRHDSVAEGLAIVNNLDAETFIAVHDGARPMISVAQITRVFNAARDTGCATSARPVTETIKRADQDGEVAASVDRDHLWLIERPQIFGAGFLTDAYRHVLANGERVTDEVSALQLIGHSTKLVTNPEPNLKITYPHDLDLAEKLITPS